MALIDSEKLEKIPRRLRQFAEFFVRLVLEEHSFYRFLPSLIGVAAIATSRYVLCLRPVWPDALAETTGYDEVTLRPCLQAILLYSSKRFPNKFVPITGTCGTATSATTSGATSPTAPSKPAGMATSPVADSPGQPSLASGAMGSASKTSLDQPVRQPKMAWGEDTNSAAQKHTQSHVVQPVKQHGNIPLVGSIESEVASAM